MAVVEVDERAPFVLAGSALDDRTGDEQVFQDLVGLVLAHGCSRVRQDRIGSLNISLKWDTHRNFKYGILL